MKKLILIKLGGSIITDKTKPYTTKGEVMQKLAKELKEIISSETETNFLLGNGGGSYAHVPAEKYDLMNGIHTIKQVYGYAEAQDKAAQLNRLIVASLLRLNIPAVTIQPSSIITAKQGKLYKIFTDSILGFLKTGLIPVVYGDFIYDVSKGSHIFSTEDLFNFLIPEFLANGYKPSKVIHVTTVDGVLDAKKEVIPVITAENFASVKKHFYAPAGYDVTGGMLHKIETALGYAKSGIETVIINGASQKKLLTNAVFGEAFVGTVIR